MKNRTWVKWQISQQSAACCRFLLFFTAWQKFVRLKSSGKLTIGGRKEMTFAKRHAHERNVFHFIKLKKTITENVQIWITCCSRIILFLKFLKNWRQWFFLIFPKARVDRVLVNTLNRKSSQQHWNRGLQLNWQQARALTHDKW